MRKTLTFPWLIFIFILSLSAAEKKGTSGFTLDKRASLIIGIPVNASGGKTDRNEWFSGLVEQYLHFRIGASNSLDIIPSETIYQMVKESGVNPAKNSNVYSSFAKDLRATHILLHTYEISRDGKSIHYYAEMISSVGSKHFGSFELNFSLPDFSSAMDSCVFWFFKASGISLNKEKLSRFFNLQTVSTDPKEMKIIGTIVARRYISTPQEIQISIKELISSVERDPHNLLAQYIAARLYESSGKYESAIEQLKNLLIILPNYASLYGDVCKNYRLSEKPAEALSYASHAERKGIITRTLMLEGALALEDMGKYTRAKKAFSIILRADSTEPNSLLFFARLNNKNQNSEAAITYADKILSENPNNGDALLEKGKALFHLKKYKEAEEVLTKSAGLVKDATVPTSLIGKIHAQSNDYEKAALFYEAALKNKSDDYALLFKAVNAWENAQKPEKALKLLQKAENIFPDSLFLQKKLGLLYYQIGDTANAIFHLEQFLEKGKKKEARVLLTLGDIYTNKANYDKAFYLYNHAIPLLKDKTKGTLSLALLYLKKGDMGAAISHLKEILKVNPEHPDAYRYLGDAWYQEGNYSAALRDYKKARFFLKEEPYIQKRIATIYFNLEEYNAAIREYQKLLTLVPKDAESLFNLAVAYLHLNKTSSAEEILEKAFESGKPDSEIFFKLGNGYAHVMNMKKAIEYYMQCITLDPKHEKGLLSLSEIYRKENREKEAAKIYLRLYELDHTRYTDYLAKAGFLYEQLNDTAQAYSIFTTFVNNNYSNPQCNIHLARMEYRRKNYKAVLSLLEKIPESEITEKSDMLALADAYCILGKPEKAIPWLEKIVSRDSKLKEALVMLSVSYDKIGDLNNALKYYKKCLDVANDKEKTIYTHQIALLYEKGDNIEEAIEAYRRNIEKYPHYLKNYNRLANLYAKAHNWGAVREILEKSIKLPNIKPFYWKKLAEVCLKQNDKAGAVKNYKEYLELNPNDDEAWMQLGDLYYNRGVFTKALNFYNKANEIKPNNFTIIYKSALAFHNSGDNKSAIKLFKKAHSLDSTNSEVLQYLALCYRSINDNENLSLTLKKLALLDPDNYSIKVELGCSLLGLGKTEEAVNILETACKMNPQETETHIILSGIYASNGNDNARYSHLKKALAINPENADIQCLLGEFYLEQKEYQTASKHIKKALELNPEHTEALYACSKYLFIQGEVDEALTYIKQAIKNDAFNSRFLVLYAKINHAVGKSNIAMKTIEDALTIDSTNSEILSYAGFLYKESDRVEEAKNILLKAISLSDKCSECFTYLGDIYFEETQCAKAAGFFRRALVILGYDEDVMMKLGRTLVLSYQNEAAKDIFEQVFIKNPDNHEAFYRLSHIYLLWKNVDKVKTLIARRKNDQKTVWDHLVQGELLEMKGNIQAALISYSVALRLHPEMPEALAGKGRIDLYKGNYNNAIVNFSKALVKDPYNPFLLLNLGKAYEGIGQYTSAFDIYSEVADKYSQIPETYKLIAGIRSRKKKHKGAVDIVQKGLKHNPESAELYSVLGRELQMLGNYMQAIEAYENAVKYGDDSYIETFLKIANIYYNNLKNEKEAKKFLKKYLKKGGKKEQLQKYNLAGITL